MGEAVKKSDAKIIDVLLTHYESLARENEDFRWSEKRRRLSLDKANSFVVFVLINQGQDANRAWRGSEHLIANHFRGRGGFWRQVLASQAGTVERICKTGYDDKTYASMYCINKFPKWLRSAAHKIVKGYGGDPRRIWRLQGKDPSVIRERFQHFDGVGDALAKMAEFILVRQYGVAGSKRDQRKLAPKPDVHLRRIFARTGLARSEAIPDFLEAVDRLELDRPIDVDAAVWSIGREFCFKTSPKCVACPLNAVCSHASRATSH